MKIIENINNKVNKELIDITENRYLFKFDDTSKIWLFIMPNLNSYDKMIIPSIPRY